MLTDKWMEMGEVAPGERGGIASPGILSPSPPFSKEQTCGHLWDRVVSTSAILLSVETENLPLNLDVVLLR